MELNQLGLNDELLANLYRQSIVLAPDSARPEGKEPTHPAMSPETVPGRPTPAFLGENRGRILILVQYPQVAFLPDSSLEFLTSILAACKLGLSDVAIVNTAGPAYPDFPGTMSALQPRVALLFGLRPNDLDLPVDFPAFQIQPHNGCTFLHGPDLEKLEADKVLKSKLWVALRRLFAV